MGFATSPFPPLPCVQPHGGEGWAGNGGLTKVSPPRRPQGPQAEPSPVPAGGFPALPWQRRFISLCLICTRGLTPYGAKTGENGARHGGRRREGKR